MATLEQNQKAERERLERLCDALDSRANDLESLMRVLVAAKDFGTDPLPHIKAAMCTYLQRSVTCGDDNLEVPIPPPPAGAGLGPVMDNGEYYLIEIRPGIYYEQRKRRMLPHHQGLVNYEMAIILLCELALGN